MSDYYSEDEQRFQQPLTLMNTDLFEDMLRHFDLSLAILPVSYLSLTEQVDLLTTAKLSPGNEIRVIQYLNKFPVYRYGWTRTRLVFD